MEFLPGGDMMTMLIRFDTFDEDTSTFLRVASAEIIVVPVITMDNVSAVVP